jgi:hypothetical protein
MTLTLVQPGLPLVQPGLSGVNAKNYKRLLHLHRSRSATGRAFFLLAPNRFSISIAPRANCLSQGA